MDYTPDFEKPINELEAQVQDLESKASESIDLSAEIKNLKTKIGQLINETYEKLSPWERVQLARHPKRPHSIDYIKEICSEFEEIHGDRSFGDDQAIITGFGYIQGQKFAIIAIEKGRKTQDKIKRNFGMPHPEGYRKALRLGELASRFKIPILTLVDTPGAYPGIAAEERGQSHAIAKAIEGFFSLSVPIISVIIGEGGSGGALGIAVADIVLMQEYSIYSVISPESCASILWSDTKMAEVAANSLKLHPNKAIELGVIDGIIKESLGGAHRDLKESAKLLQEKVLESLKSIKDQTGEEILESRYQKFRKIGNQFIN